MAVAQLNFALVVCYVLPVSWMTPSFAIMIVLSVVLRGNVLLAPRHRRLQALRLGESNMCRGEVCYAPFPCFNDEERDD